jgi:hypothetical protein
MAASANRWRRFVSSDLLNLCRVIGLPFIIVSKYPIPSGANLFAFDLAIMLVLYFESEAWFSTIRRPATFRLSIPARTLLR